MMKRIEVSATLKNKFRTESTIGGHSLVVDQPPAAGGDNDGPTPLDYFLLSIAGCQATIARIIAMQKRIDLRAFNVRVEGDLDTEVLLGKSSENRCGFTGLKIQVEVDADMTREEKEAFIHEVDRRCPVSENVLNTTPIEVVLAE